MPTTTTTITTIWIIHLFSLSLHTWMRFLRRVQTLKTRRTLRKQPSIQSPLCTPCTRSRTAAIKQSLHSNPPSFNPVQTCTQRRTEKRGVLSNTRPSKSLPCPKVVPIHTWTLFTIRTKRKMLMILKNAKGRKWWTNPNRTMSLIMPIKN